jgi:hypothetical protein
MVRKALCSLELANRTISPFTRSAAAIDSIVPPLTTLHDGGIMAKKEAKIASDLDGKSLEGDGGDKPIFFLLLELKPFNECV